MARGRTSQVNRPKPRNHQHKDSNNAIASSSQSPSPAPWVDESAMLDSWNNPYDNSWEWEAAGDASIASDDPKREEKIRWRIQNNHVHSADYRVKRWREALGNQPLATVDEVATYVERPYDIYSGDGGRSRSRSRSRSKGRQGKKDRTNKLAEWRKKAPLLARPLPSFDVDSTARTVSDDLQAWIDDLVQKGKYRNVQRDRALAFFELPLSEKVNKVETISRELVGATMIRV